jgi:sugar-phosphatase
MAAIFDMDGLLFDTDPHLWVESMHEVAHDNGVAITKELLKYTKGLRIYEVTEFWNERFGWKDSNKARQLAEDVLDNIIARTIAKGRIMPGVYPLLEELKMNSVPMGVATSSPARMVKALLQHFGLEDYFQSVNTADNCVVGKPHPEVYLQCAAALNTLPWRCVAFEDSINGMVAAKAARMLLVAVPEPQQFDNPKFGLADLLIPSLEQFSFADYVRLLDI